MRRIRILSIVLLCTGLILTGIGMGVAFIEFTSLTYTGEQVLKQAQASEQIFLVQLEEDGGPIYIEEHFDYTSDGPQVFSVSSSEAIAPNSMKIQVSYDTVGPSVSIWTSASDEESSYRVGMGWKGYQDFPIMMMYKDEVLQQLKEGCISNYLPVQLKQAVITVNPADLQRVQLDGESAVIEIS